jgi:hypothetical protein
LLSYKIIVDAAADDDDEFEDDMSIDSDTSAESIDTLEFVVRHTYDYGSYRLKVESRGKRYTE